MEHAGGTCWGDGRSESSLQLHFVLSSERLRARPPARVDGAGELTDGADGTSHRGARPVQAQKAPALVLALDVQEALPHHVLVHVPVHRWGPLSNQLTTVIGYYNPHAALRGYGKMTFNV